MSELREWWQNAYQDKQKVSMGATHSSRRLADWHAYEKRNSCIHVRLKPEGAPKRYAAPHHREIWEDDPDWCRQMEAKKPGFWDRASAFHARAPRTPKD